MMNFKAIRFLIASVAMSFLIACAAPATKTIKIGKDELRREQQAQTELINKTTPKAITNKYKELSKYEARLLKIAKPLEDAARPLCKSKRCSYNYKVINEDMLNAYTDGKNVVISAQMMEFLEQDKELATVMAHEIAHNTMGHRAKKMQNSIVGCVFDVVAIVNGYDSNGIFTEIGAMTYSQGFENEADYVGIYIMARAGYDISNVSDLWRKMTIQTKRMEKPSFFNTHPSNSERYLRMQHTIDEIKNKKKNKIPLIPNGMSTQNI